MFKKLKFTLYYWFNLVVIKVLIARYLQRGMQLRSFGNPGATWKVPPQLLSKKSICYCAGVGEDISFEKELYTDVQPALFLFDPTPRAIDYIKEQKLPRKIQFSPWGLWSKNSKQKFFAPPVDSFVSHSIVNLHQTQKYFIADCKSLSWIMKELGHDHLDMLKIDIEGAEYMVLEQLLSTQLRPKVLAVEFDQPTPVNKTFSMVLELIIAGYSLVDQTGWNFIFVYNSDSLR